jgi:hypothetical protein
LFAFKYDKGRIEGVRYDCLRVLFVNAFKEQQAQLRERELQAARQQYQLDQYRQQLVSQ